MTRSLFPPGAAQCTDETCGGAGSYVISDVTSPGGYVTHVLRSLGSLFGLVS